MDFVSGFLECVGLGVGERGETTGWALYGHAQSGRTIVTERPHLSPLPLSALYFFHVSSFYNLLTGIAEPLCPPWTYSFILLANASSP
jgi:hypothetical protein